MEKNDLPLFCFMAKHGHSRTHTHTHTHRSLCITLHTLGSPCLNFNGKPVLVWCAWLRVLQCFLLWSTHQLSCFSTSIYQGERLCWACMLFRSAALFHVHILTRFHTWELSSDPWLLLATERSRGVSLWAEKLLVHLNCQDSYSRVHI